MRTAKRPLALGLLAALIASTGFGCAQTSTRLGANQPAADQRGTGMGSGDALGMAMFGAQMASPARPAVATVPTEK
jgi:hypothetical protein